jgi:hypothetical protein
MGTVKHLTPEEEAQVEKTLKDFSSKEPERPISELPPGRRLGALFRRQRLGANRSLRETAEALDPTIDSHVVLGQIERGVRPATSDQIQAFCDYIGHGTEVFFEAARDYHRAVWQAQQGGVEVVEQTAKVATIGPVYDQQELLSALRSAISSMDIAADWMGRMMRIVRLIKGSEQDAMTAASVVMMLEAGAQFAKGLLERPLDVTPGYDEAPDWRDDKPRVIDDPDWRDADHFELGKVYEHRTGKLMRVAAHVVTVGHGDTLVAEDTSGSLIPVGDDSDSAMNYREVPESRWWKAWLEGNDDDELRAKYEAALKAEQA